MSAGTIKNQKNTPVYFVMDAAVGLGVGGVNGRLAYIKAGSVSLSSQLTQVSEWKPPAPFPNLFPVVFPQV